MALRRPRLRLVTAALTVLALAAAVAYGQGVRFREGSLAARYAPTHMPDGAFVVCRLQYRSVRFEPMGIGWITDYPSISANVAMRHINSSALDNGQSAKIGGFIRICGALHH